MTSVDGQLDPESIDPGFRPTPTPVAIEPVEGEAILLDRTTGALHLLNPPAAMVWGLLDGQSSIEEIAGGIAGATGAPAPQVQDEVLALLRDLGRLGLLVGVTGDSTIT